MAKCKSRDELIFMSYQFNVVNKIVKVIISEKLYTIHAKANIPGPCVYTARHVRCEIIRPSDGAYTIGTVLNRRATFTFCTN